MKAKFIYIYITILFVFWGFVVAETSQISVAINWFWIIIGSPSNIQLGVLNPLDSVITGFDDYFWINDLRGSNTGHYTTIQSNWLFWPNNALVTWIDFMYNIPTKLAGLSNNTFVLTPNNWIDITQPKLYFYRNTSITNGGVWNKYGESPFVKIDIPSWYPVWVYSWEITYTLYDYDTNITN